MTILLGLGLFALFALLSAIFVMLVVYWGNSQ